MISYDRDPQQTIPESSVKIIGLGGAGANMLDRAALDGITGAEMLCINTDIRTLTSSVAGEKIQIGKNLTKGLGAGGDPAIGLQAAQESELAIRDSIRGRKIIFICVGLGGGTGSGAAPLVARIAREEDAFVVIFATMPFDFEGQRRREQADTALNELAVISNALVTFDNGRMGELILADQGIHEAFAAADRMISESIKAVTRLVIRPGLINVGLDDLMSALRTTRSRCLFGSGLAEGENRAQHALDNALTSPLLDKGSLLNDAASVLVHVCGGESLTLYEVELLMQNLTKHVPDDAHILFGAAIDPTMGESLSVTIVSALPDNKLNTSEETSEDNTSPKEAPSPEPPTDKEAEETTDNPDPALARAIASAAAAVGDEGINATIESPEDEKIMDPSVGFGVKDKHVEKKGQKDSDTEAEQAPPISPEEDTAEAPDKNAIPDFDNTAEDKDASEEQDAFSPFAETADSKEKPQPEDEIIRLDDFPTLEEDEPEESSFPSEDPIPTAQGELQLDGTPKGKFEGEQPNLLDGEDLDIPPFLRKKN